MKEDLLSEILDLSPAERIRLAQDIWASVSELPDTAKLTDGQKEELKRRLRLLDDNPDEGIPWRDVISKLQSKQ